MTTHSTHEVTGLLQAWGRGDAEALQKLIPLVHRELRQAARRYMARERSGHLLQTTALVNETYLRLVGVKKVSWQNRAHFLAMCAQLMRRILTDFARSRRFQKRSGNANRVTFTNALWIAPQSDTDFAALDAALEKLAAVDERKSRVVEMRFFGGLTVQESAEVLKISQDTVMRDWKMAKVWLLRELNGEGHRGT
jgi:RNA polymerase sigma-70 factor (ECF subfamily)